MSKYLPNPQSVKSIAAAYTSDLNFAVVPVNGKIPEGVKGWQTGRICTPSEVSRFFKDHHNVGIVTGRYDHDDQPNLTRVWVLDVDWKEEKDGERVAPTWGEDGRPVRTPDTTLVKNGYEELDKLTSEHGPLPATWTVRTGGGGTHYYWRIPEGVGVPSHNDWRPFIDIRGQGGQVVAPPSIHAETGVEYEWFVNNLNLPVEPPQWLLDLALEKSRKDAARVEAARKLTEEKRAKNTAAGLPDSVLTPSRNLALKKLSLAAGDVSAAREGARHELLRNKTYVVRKMYGGRGILSDEEIEEAMTEAGLACGLPEYEVESTVNSAMVKGEEQQDSAYDPIPNPPSPADQAIMNFVQSIGSNSTSNGGGSTPPPPPSGGGGGGSNGGGGTPPPPPPAAGAAPAGNARPQVPRAPIPVSRNPLYPVDVNTFNELSRGAGQVINGVRTWGTPHAHKSNVCIVFDNDPLWRDAFKYNQLGEEELWTPVGQAQAKPLEEAAITEIVTILSQQYSLRVSDNDVVGAAHLASLRRTFNPVREYLMKQAWDGVPRIDTWLQDYMGAEDAPLFRAMARKWLVSAVARGMSDRSKVDTMLIVKGGQGARKSTAFKTLCEDIRWYSESPFNLEGKDAQEKLRGKWIYEVAELSPFTRNAVSQAHLKNFLTCEEDNYRKAYRRDAKDYPRRMVFCGTTNENQFLFDPTGARRFWVVEAGDKVDIDGLRAVRDQLWAEAMHVWRTTPHDQANCPWWLTPAEEDLQKDSVDQFTGHDPLLEALVKFSDQRNFFTATDFFKDLNPNTIPTTADGRRLNTLMQTLGTHVYVRVRLIHGGPQIRGYQRITQLPTGQQGAFSSNPNFKP